MNAGFRLPNLALEAPRTRLLFAALAVAAIPFLSLMTATLMGRHLQVYTPNMIFLCGVILAAIWFGRTVALCTAASSFLLYNYSLTDPRNELGFSGLNDVLTITIFLLVAFLIGGLAGTLRDERNKAREQVRTLSKLFAASQTMADCRDAATVLHHLPEASHGLHGDVAALFERDATGAVLVTRSPASAQLPVAITAHAAAFLEQRVSPSDQPTLGWHVEKIEVDGTKAVLAWRKPRGVYPAQQEMAGDLLIKLALAALERTQAAARQVAIKAMEDTDRLRTALLSSISHDFRTPLATITASASSLMAYGETFTERTRSDLLSSIQEEAERLSRFVGNVLDMTRLEAGVLKTRAEWTDPLELIENVRDRVEKRAASHEISVTAPAALPAIEVDPVLLEQALVNVIDNALIHTPAGSRIEIGSTHAGSTVRLWVEDSGAGVDPAELKQIFDKFYRPAGSGHAAGLGLGLAITKALVEAMDGTVSASGAANGESGLRIEFAFRATSVSEVA